MNAHTARRTSITARYTAQMHEMEEARNAYTDSRDKLRAAYARIDEINQQRRDAEYELELARMRFDTRTEAYDAASAKTRIACLRMNAAITAARIRHEQGRPAIRPLLTPAATITPCHIRQVRIPSSVRKAPEDKQQRLVEAAWARRVRWQHRHDMRTPAGKRALQEWLRSKIQHTSMTQYQDMPS